MTTTFDVIVIGGGTMGSAAAWELGKRGINGLVLEQFRHVHQLGSHGGKTRIIRHAYAESPDYVPLVRRADSLWLELEAATGAKVLHRTGGLEIAGPGHDHAQAARASAKEHHLAYEWLTASEANQRWPAFTIPDDWQVLYSPDAGFLLTEPSLIALGAAARHLGIAIHEEEPARTWGADGSGVWVRTDQATYHADHLIIAAGPWAGAVLSDLGLPLTVLRKVLWWFEVTDANLYQPDRFPIFISGSDSGELYGFPIFDHVGLKIANHRGGEPTSPDTVDRSVTEAERDEIVSGAQVFLTGVTNRAVDHAVCLYTVTPDTDFIIDRHPNHSQVAIAAGFSGHGFKFATAVAEHLVDLALNPLANPYPHLALSRFATTAGAI